MNIFKRGLPVYHFENRAREDSGITLNDRTFKNFHFSLQSGRAILGALRANCSIVIPVK